MVVASIATPRNVRVGTGTIWSISFRLARAAPMNSGTGPSRALRAIFEWSDDEEMIVGLTPVGRATVETLDMNRESRRAARRFWFDAGLLP